jgi:hypothetical protein
MSAGIAPVCDPTTYTRLKYLFSTANPGYRSSYKILQSGRAYKLYLWVNKIKEAPSVLHLLTYDIRYHNDVKILRQRPVGRAAEANAF